MRVKELLKEKGITAKELAGKLGMTETGLGIAISEKGNPPLKRLQEIANALNVPFTELFERESKTEVTALVEYKKDFYKAETLQELKTIVSKIETAEKE